MSLPNTFTEVILNEGEENEVRLFYNPINFPIETQGAVHRIELNPSFILPPKGGASLCKFLSTYEVSKTLRRDFKRWAARGKYPFLNAVFYAVKNPQMTRYRVLSAHSPHLEGYYRTQNHLVAEYVTQSMEGRFPIKGPLE